MKEKYLTTDYPNIFFEDNKVGQLKKRIWDASEAEIDAINDRLRALRRELKLCARIEHEAPTVRAHLGAAQLPGPARSKTHEKTHQSRPNRRSEHGADVLPGAGGVR